MEHKNYTKYIDTKTLEILDLNGSAFGVHVKVSFQSNL